MSGGEMQGPTSARGRAEIGSLARVLTLFPDRAIERERANELARRQAHILGELYDAVVTVDAEERIVDWNAAAERLFGYTREEILGRTTDVLYVSEEEARRLKTEMRAQLEAQGRWLGECDNRRKDGTLVTLETVVFRLQDDRGRAIGTVGVSRDITARRRAEEMKLELIRAKEEAELASHAKSQFLAHMSHELRTPLNVIIGMTELLIEDADETDNRGLADALERILRAGQQLLALIDEILDLSKIEAGHMELHPVDFSLSELVEEIAATAEPLAARNRNRLTVECRSDPGLVHHDEDRVRQVILNLVSNACKFCEDGAVRLVVEHARSDGIDGAAVTVADTGIGISAEQMTRLFRPFSQGDARISRRYEGSGLGLVISQRFCDMMGGDITVESEPGRGSTFTVWLPRAAPAAS